MQIICDADADGDWWIARGIVRRAGETSESEFGVQNVFNGDPESFLSGLESCEAAGVLRSLDPDVMQRLNNSIGFWKYGSF